MVEPLEETRNELIFATEPVLSSLHLSIPGSFQYSPLVELDEVEVRVACSIVFDADVHRSHHYRSKRASCNYARASPSSTHPLA